MVHELKFKDNKRALKRLEKASKRVDRVAKSSSTPLTRSDKTKLKRSLRKRAKALSKATGMKIHSIC